MVQVVITATKLNMDTLTLTAREVAKINRVVANKFLNRLEFIPRRIAQENNINMTGFKRVRRKRTRALVKNRSRGMFWIGENNVLAQYTKGAFRQTSTGAGKGSFFKKDAFIINTKNGKMISQRHEGKIVPVKKVLSGYERVVSQELAKAQRPVLADYAKEINLTFGRNSS